MDKEYLELLNSHFKEAMNYSNKEKDKVKSFKSLVNTVKSYNQIINKIEPELLESFDLEEEDQRIIEYYKEISKINK